MRILFICGSLEPGKDGVGDYCYRLVSELSLIGHQVSLIALNDPFIHKEIKDEFVVAQYSIDRLRIPGNLDKKYKYHSAKQFINTIKPDWISLQFVPYSFNIKGLPFGIGRELKRIGEPYNWHVMFHEGWIVPNKQTKFKNRMVSFFQKRIIQNVLKQLNPKVKHTSNELYQQEFEREGVDTKILGLFSNIEVSSKSIIKMQQEFASINIHPGERNKWVVLGIFGTIRKRRRKK